MPSVRKLGKSVATTYAARIVSVVSLFVLFPAVARVAPPADYGVYLLTAGLASLFGMDLGLAGSTTRFVSSVQASGDHGRTRSVVAAGSAAFGGLALASSSGLVLMLLLGWGSFGFSPDQVPLALATSASAVLQVALGCLAANDRAILTGLGRIDTANGVLIGQALLRFFATIAILTFTPSIPAVAVVDAASVAAGLVALRFARRRALGVQVRFWRDFEMSTVRQMLGLTRDLLVMSVAATVILYAGGLVVGAAASTAAVALFSAGQRIYQVAKEVPNSLTAPLLPVATANDALSPDANRMMYLAGTKVSLAVVMATFPPVVYYMNDFVVWWLGPDYLPSSAIASVLVASIALNCLHLVAVPVLGGQGDLRAYSALHAIWALSAVVVGWPLTVALGPIGMAMGIAAPLLVLEPIYISVALKRVGAHWAEFLRTSVFPPLAVAGIPFVALLVWSSVSPSAGFASAVLRCALWLALYCALGWFILLSRDRRLAMIRYLTERTGGRA